MDYSRITTGKSVRIVLNNSGLSQKTQ